MEESAKRKEDTNLDTNLDISTDVNIFITFVKLLKMMALKDYDISYFNSFLERYEEYDYYIKRGQLEEAKTRVYRLVKTLSKIKKNNDEILNDLGVRIEIPEGSFLNRCSCLFIHNQNPSKICFVFFADSDEKSTKKDQIEPLFIMVREIQNKINNEIVNGILIHDKPLTKYEYDGDNILVFQLNKLLFCGYDHFLCSQIEILSKKEVKEILPGVPIKNIPSISNDIISQYYGINGSVVRYTRNTIIPSDMIDSNFTYRLHR